VTDEVPLVGPSVEVVVVVLLEIITVPLLNSASSGDFSIVDVVLLESNVVPSLNSGISERSPAGGGYGAPCSSGSCANALRK